MVSFKAFSGYFGNGGNSLRAYPLFMCGSAGPF